MSIAFYCYWVLFAIKRDTPMIDYEPSHSACSKGLHVVVVGCRRLCATSFLRCLLCARSPYVLLLFAAVTHCVLLLLRLCASVLFVSCNVLSQYFHSIFWLNWLDDLNSLFFSIEMHFYGIAHALLVQRFVHAL